MKPDTKPTTVVIFGASGDLTQRKLIPALYNLHRKGRLPANINIVGTARTPFSHDAFRDKMYTAIESSSEGEINRDSWQAFVSRLWYHAGDSQNPAFYSELEQYLPELEEGPADRLYYLATAPELFQVIADHLHKSDLDSQKEGWRRLAIEKPFGDDLVSAQALNRAVHRSFSESQVYRLDHYLGKETAQNILFFRFANAIFEPIWNRNYIDNIQISALEEIGVGHRGKYYDRAGILRDMFQNHLLQLLCLVAMEPPASFEAEAVRNEKAKVLTAIPPLELSDTVRGQYQGYRESPGVAPDSKTATYAALELYVQNWRWQGVPFYLRSGKGLQRKETQIIVEFRCPPHLIFEMPPFAPNQLAFYIQPDEGMHLGFEAKVPDTAEQTRTVSMGFHYHSYFGSGPLPDAYERLLLDVLHGDRSLFPRQDAIELSWQLIDPIVQGWESDAAPPLSIYPTGSAGPPEADALLARAGRCWRAGCCTV